METEQAKPMNQIETTQNVPLTTAEGGAIRVAGTRVNLETIVYQFDAGASAETIADRFPALTLADVYAVIAYYLAHKTAVDDYLRRREQEADRIRKEIENKQEDRRLVRERLLRRAVEQ